MHEMMTIGFLAENTRSGYSYSLLLAVAVLVFLISFGPLPRTWLQAKREAIDPSRSEATEIDLAGLDVLEAFRDTVPQAATGRRPVSTDPPEVQG